MEFITSCYLGEIIIASWEEKSVERGFRTGIWVEKWSADRGGEGTALFPSSLLESMELGMEVNSWVTGYNHIEVQVYTERIHLLNYWAIT